MFGTGDEMLKALSLLLSYLHGLTDLTLRELQLESYECNNFIDDVNIDYIYIFKILSYKTFKILYFHLLKSLTISTLVSPAANHYHRMHLTFNDDLFTTIEVI